MESSRSSTRADAVGLARAPGRRGTQRRRPVGHRGRRRIEQAAGQAGTVDLRSFELTGGVDQLRLTLGHRPGRPDPPDRRSEPLRFERPAGVHVQLKLSGGAARVEFDGQKLGATAGQSDPRDDGRCGGRRPLRDRGDRRHEPDHASSRPATDAARTANEGGPPITARYCSSTRWTHRSALFRFAARLGRLLVVAWMAWVLVGCPRWPGGSIRAADPSPSPATGRRPARRPST